MKIRVQSEKKKFCIWVPTGLVANGLTAKIVSTVIRKNVPQKDWPFDEKQLSLLFRELNRAHKLHRGMSLVDVEAADGSGVQIYL